MPRVDPWRDAFSRFALFENASKETIDTIVEEAIFQRFEPKAIVLRKGQHPTHHFFLIEGAVRVVQTKTSGLEYTPKIFSAPMQFGDLAVLSGSEGYLASIEALVPSVAAKIKSSVIDDLLSSDAGLCKSWLTSVVNQYVTTIDFERQSSLGGLSERVITVLLTYDDLFGVSTPNGRRIEYNLSYANIAKHVGSTKRAVIRVLNELQEEKIVVRDGETWEINRSSLRQTKPELATFSNSLGA